MGNPSGRVDLPGMRARQLTHNHDMPMRTAQDILRDCRAYVQNSGEIAEASYDDYESEFYLDPRVFAAAKRIRALLEEIDYVLSTKH